MSTSKLHFTNDESMHDCFDHICEVVEITSTAAVGADTRIDDDFIVVITTDERIAKPDQDAISKRFAPVRAEFNVSN